MQSTADRLRAEIARRQKLKTDRLTRFQDDPVGFIELGILGTLWSKQKEICEALRVHRHVAVQSCHDVGKSFIAASIACWWNACNEPGEAFVVKLETTVHQVRAILWREMARIHSQGQLPGYMNQTEWKLDNGELIGMGRSPKDTDPTAIQGIHQRKVLCIFDEACGMATALWDAAESLVANEMSRFLAIGNPDDPSSEFATVCKPGSGWHVIKISAFDSPNFTGEVIPEFLKPLLVSKIWVEERRRKWGENSPVYISKVKGEFPTQAADALLSLGDITAAFSREMVRSEAPVELGVDVARYGKNFTVVYGRWGDVAKKLLKRNGLSTMQTAGHVVQLINETGATSVKIDDSGVGGGVTDRLKELQQDRDCPFDRNCKIVPVNSGEKSRAARRPKADPKNKKVPETERFVNLRADLNWDMRERFTTGLIMIEPTFEDRVDEDLQAQAADIKYEVTSRGAIQIESKDDMEARGRQSPDDWDALVLAFANLETTEPIVITDALLAAARRPVPGRPRL